MTVGLNVRRVRRATVGSISVVPYLFAVRDYYVNRNQCNKDYSQSDDDKNTFHPHHLCKLYLAYIYN